MVMRWQRTKQVAEKWLQFAAESGDMTEFQWLGV